jgi:hypothetical protein
MPQYHLFGSGEDALPGEPRGRFARNGYHAEGDIPIIQSAGADNFNEVDNESQILTFVTAQT